MTKALSDREKGLLREKILGLEPDNDGADELVEYISGLLGLPGCTQASVQADLDGLVSSPPEVLSSWIFSSLLARHSSPPAKTPPAKTPLPTPSPAPVSASTPTPTPAPAVISSPSSSSSSSSSSPPAKSLRPPVASAPSIKPTSAEALALRQKRFSPHLEAALDRPLGGASNNGGKPAKPAKGAASPSNSSSSQHSQKNDRESHKKQRNELLCLSSDESEERGTKKQRTASSDPAGAGSGSGSGNPGKEATLCSHFPHCSFGTSCRFTHPAIPCKFQPYCTRSDCNYTHLPAPMAQQYFAPPMYGGAMQSPPCRYGFSCPNRSQGCTFQHPASACRYGAGCKRLGLCLFSHDPPCTFGQSCSRPSCRFAHPSSAGPAASSSTASLVENPQTDAAATPEAQEAVETLSESLPPTP